MTSKSNEFEYNSKVLKGIIDKVNDGSTKDEVVGYLIVELDVASDPSVRYKWIEKYIKESGVKFKRPGGNWDICLDFFKKMKDEKVKEPNPDDFVKYLEEHSSLTEEQSSKYKSSYWYPLKGMYDLMK